MLNWISSIALGCLIGGIVVGYLYPQYSFIGGASFGLVGIWMVCEAKAQLKHRNEEIEQRWLGRLVDKADEHD